MTRPAVRRCGILRPMLRFVPALLLLSACLPEFPKRDFVADPTADNHGDLITELTGDCDDDHSLAYPCADEVCDGIDNDCDGQTDEETGGGDQYESNDSCSAANNLGGATQGYSYTIDGATLDKQGDEDWFKVEYQEAADLLGSESFKFTIKLSNIQQGHDYDLCVWPQTKSVTYTDKTGAKVEQSPKNQCGPIYDEIDNEGACMGLNIFELGTKEEIYVAEWEGEWFQNDDNTFIIKVFDYDAPDVECAEPYKLELIAQ